MAKILLVEDDKNLQEIYAAQLMAEGHTIVSAYDGEQGLSMAASEHPDLIITDAMMPRVSGLQFLDILRSTPATANIKVIAMTALSQADDRAQFEKLGVERFLVKSQVTLEDVARVVNEVLNPSSTVNAPVSQVFGAPQSEVAPSLVVDTSPEQTTVPTMPESTNVSEALATEQPMTTAPADSLMTEPVAPQPSISMSNPGGISTSDEQNDVMQQIQNFVATSPVINTQVSAPTSVDGISASPTTTPAPAADPSPVVVEPAAPISQAADTPVATTPTPDPVTEPVTEATQTPAATVPPAQSVNQSDLDIAL